MSTFSFLFVSCGSSFRTSWTDRYVNPAKASHQAFSFPLSLLCLFEKAERPGPPKSWPHVTGEPSCGRRGPALGGLLSRAAFRLYYPTASSAACFLWCVHTRSAAKLINNCHPDFPLLILRYNFFIISSNHLLIPWPTNKSTLLEKMKKYFKLTQVQIYLASIYHTNSVKPTCL